MVASASACAGGGDKAGGEEAADPRVLTLAAYAQPEPDDVVAAVQRLSGGSLRIKATTLWRDGEPDYEEATIADVRRGDVDLAIVAARAFDLVGTTSFHAVLAPFLVDSLELEGRVLESQLAQRMLAGVENVGRGRARRPSRRAPAAGRLPPGRRSRRTTSMGRSSASGRRRSWSARTARSAHGRAP